VNCKTAPVKAVQGGNALSYAIVGEKEYSEWRNLALNDAATAEGTKMIRDELLAASQARVANWPNTIEALRRRKEKARTERLEAEETRRCIIDKHEAELARAKQKNNIDKANLMLYETDDRVKNFTSKMVLASVLEERAKQIDLLKKKEEAQYEQETKWAILQEETLRRANKEEEDKQFQLRQRAQNFKTMQQKHIDSIKEIKLNELREDKAEGQRILKAAQDSIREELEEERKRKEKAAKIKEELVKANELQKELKAERKRQDALEAENIERFAQQKDQQLMERKKRVEERFQAKMNLRQEIIDRQSAHLKAIQDAAVDRELKQTRELEKERDIKEAAEMEKKKEFYKDVVKSRTAQIKRKEDEELRRVADKQKISAMYKSRAVDLIEEEVQERLRTKEASIAVQHFQLMQAQEREMQKTKAREQKVIEALMVKKAIQDDDDMFKGYVNAVMSEYVKAGKSTSTKLRTD